MTEQTTPKTTAELVEELLQNGTVTLTAKSRHEIYQLADSLAQAIPEGSKWTRAAVVYDSGTFTFSQKYSILNAQ